jgi:hypothetical protein
MHPDVQNIVYRTAVVVLLLMILYQCADNGYFEYFYTVDVKSKVDGGTYRVASIYNDTQEAADTIANLNEFVTDVIAKLKHVYVDSDAPAGRMQEHIKGRQFTMALLTRFSPKSVKENVPVDPEKTSYVKNKGEEISMCLREKQSGKSRLHSLDLLKFVMLHELAHMTIIELDHSSDFWDHFKFLLDFCHHYGLYAPPDYSRQNVQYCGITVNYNPFHNTDGRITYFGQN